MTSNLCCISQSVSHTFHFPIFLLISSARSVLSLLIWSARSVRSLDFSFDLYSISIRYLFDLYTSVLKQKSSLLNLSVVITFVLTIDFINISKLYYYVITFVFSIDFLPSSSFRFFFVSICTRRGEVSEYFRLLQFFYLFDIFQTFFY